jgi:uncharacterized membrane protein
MSLLTQYLLPMTILAAVGSGAMAGLFFVFSNTIMKALSRLPAEQGMAAMQFINVVILNPVFMLFFLGTSLLCLVLALHAVFRWQGTVSLWLLVGSVLYLAGSFGVTAVFNVPLNNVLAAAPASAAAKAWPAYVGPWLVWNHVRTITCLGAAASLTYAASLLGRSAS